MRNDLLIKIKELKKLLNKNEISTEDAVEQYISLLNSFQGEYADDQSDMIFDHTLSNICVDFLEKNKKLKERMNSLNRILILQELGIKFSKDELNALLWNEH